MKWKTPEDILNGANFHRIHGPDVKWTPGKVSFKGICSCNHWTFILGQASKTNQNCGKKEAKHTQRIMFKM